MSTSRFGSAVLMRILSSTASALVAMHVHPITRAGLKGRPHPGRHSGQPRLAAVPRCQSAGIRRQIPPMSASNGQRLVRKFRLTRPL